ncbi:hypothetical protein DPMN_096859 [Dreissena polymorpha]|uniref:Uncharacterized protein n=1 Tax=Dreissena polymorpha TaxID=45954 RepID=A0A9D4LBW2_DREPO|nr:hypothetical protein DPMN_096859 [Dreissena polymorpha]
MTIVCFLFSGWHRRLNHKANDSCPPFYLLAKLMHDEAVTAVRNAELVSDMKLRRYQRATYVTLQGKTFALWKSYREGNLTATGLLKAFSCLYKPSVSVTDAIE